MLLISALFIHTRPARAEDVPIKVGVILPLTGDFAFFGEQAKLGIEIALTELNRDKQLVKVVYEDEKCLPKEAIKAFKKLVSIDKVDQVLGPVCTGSIVSVAQSAKSMKQYFLALLDANRQVAESSNFTYAIGYSSEEEAELVAEHVLSQGHTRVGIIYEEDAWAIGIREAFKKRFLSRGGTLVADESQLVTNATSAPNYRPLLTKVLAYKPNALFVVPAYNGGFFIKQVRSMGSTIPVFGPDTFAISEVIEIAHEAANGVVCANASISERSPAALKLRESLSKRLGRDPTSIFYPGLGYDGLHILATVARSGKPFPEAIQSLSLAESVLGLPKFDTDRQSKLSPALFTILNQKLAPLPK